VGIFQETRGGVMHKIRAVILLWVFGVVGTLSAILPEGSVVTFSSPEGRHLMETSKFKGDFWQLSCYFITQKNVGYCSVASSVMVLNALEIEKPEVVEYKNNRLFTQENFFTPAVRKSLLPEFVRGHGMNLDQVKGALETFDLQVTLYPGDSLSIERLRFLLKEVLNDPQRLMIAEYHRQKLEQKGVGHFSPIAAYNEQADMVLILDVSRYKYPPVWVKLPLFLSSLQGGDSEGKALGVVIVSEPQKKTAS